MQPQLAVYSTEFVDPASAYGRPIGAAPASDDCMDAFGTIAPIKAGGEIYAEGDSADCWYQVRSGVVRTCKLMSDGRRQIDRFFYPGEVFGLEVGGEHRFAAEAVTTGTVSRYSRARLRLSVAEDPRLSARLLQATLGGLEKAQDRLLLLGCKTAEEKLASFFLEMLERSAHRNAFELPMSRTDIGDYLGLTIETVSRTFSVLKKDEVISLPSAHRVVVIDREELLARSGGD